MSTTDQSNALAAINEDTHPVPGAPHVHPFDVEHSNRLYTLSYRHGNNPNCTKVFPFKGTFRDAMERARKHCEKMGYRFIILRPLISNLEDDEKARDNGITI